MHLHLVLRANGETLLVRIRGAPQEGFRRSAAQYYMDEGVPAVNLFAYGTLIDRRALFRITGRSLPQAVPATLHGYRRWETTLGYSVVLPEAGAACSGIVYYSLTASDWERLDAYENIKGNPPSYFRKLVTVQGAHGSISTFVYVGNLNFFRTRLKL